jgi:hypothetical protein
VGNPGSVNTGGGGGGGTWNGSSNQAGGAGGSGIVIIKFPKTFDINIGAGLTGTTIIDNTFKITTFTAGTGTVTFS